MASAEPRDNAALGTLLGMLLFCSVDDGWLLENEAHLEEASWRQLFDDLSAAWRAVLAQGDAVLGLAPEGGKAAGYRPKLLALLADWQAETNVALGGYDHPGRLPIRLEIDLEGGKKAKAKKSRAKK